MVFKDWIYTISILLTFCVSALSLYLNWLNRRNAIREHLYKEQFEFYKKFIVRSTEVLVLFNLVRTKELSASSQSGKISNEIVELHKFVVHHSLIIPNSLEPEIRNVKDTFWMLLSIMNNKGHLEDSDVDNISIAISELVGSIRNEIGADYLTDENKKILGSYILSPTDKNNIQQDQS